MINKYVTNKLNARPHGVLRLASTVAHLRRLDWRSQLVHVPCPTGRLAMVTVLLQWLRSQTLFGAKAKLSDSAKSVDVLLNHCSDMLTLTLDPCTIKIYEKS